MKLSQVAEIVSADFRGKDKEFELVISTDTRTLQPGAFFIALQGPRFDGNNFVEEARKRGAVGALVTRIIEIELPLIFVSNTIAALTQLASYQRKQVQLPMIAITGSCGKTTIRALLASILRQCGNVLASERSFNNSIGVPLTLLRLRPEHNYAVVELGASYPGEISCLTQLVKPTIAIISNAAPAHLEGFSNIEGVAKAKGEIFQGLLENGVAVININDCFADFWRSLVNKRRIITFGVNHTAEIMAKNIKINAAAQPTFQLITPKGEIDIQLLLIGVHNVANALAAAAAAYAEDLPLTAIKSGLETASAVKGRLAEQKGYHGAVIIDDSYNANPLSVSVAIDVLSKRKGNSILVFGDMLELGEGCHQFHREIGEYALQLGIQQLFCYGDFTKFAVEAFGKNAHHFNNQNQLLSALKGQLNENCVVLIKGSFFMSMSKIVNALLIEE
ncbi:UDP-N-acetylmuramoyl-tripeptide--D-alanyl-D-alanine ligase [Coxiella endosymbiont of Amblyomma nuttalli]|uniref:UDP-N-acetylmuramoyl-tripeptide--D-alanyl-D- alanine ligase n=1 Tax=Coxiella endosymbiont of Amblyomma nuttalli TaxID=2749996 RepID=UPI001BA7665F|nr:UDP-N-acetylmuramoyl-tripeptide--D-alanyl-D-alanine ligase [Coxiella endosymbiont of Amblyomma nuttalli]QTS83752.1 UDP-N-acetylmuramoyl-tripeptide--D-alanyl-D-alanine ligase [Coxiella endosymbiont of Amblyomma nuttalli]